MTQSILMLLIFMVFFYMDRSGYQFSLVGFDDQDTKKNKFDMAKDLLFSFKKGDMKMPEPDPAIGQAALDNIKLGDSWLEFSKTQFADQQGRQDKLDELASKVVDNQVNAQNTALKWGEEDRKIAQDFLTKYSEIADQDRAKGIEYRDQLDTMSQNIISQAQETGQELKLLGKTSADNIRSIGTDIGNKSEAAAAKMDEYAQSFGDTGQEYADRFNEQAGRQGEFGKSQLERYGSDYIPIEQRQAKDAMEWDSEARMNQRAAEAKAGVMSEADNIKQIRERDMARMGIDPRSGRYAGIAQADDQQVALASADAQNRSRRDVEREAIALRDRAIATGQAVQQTGQQANQLETSMTGAGLQAEQTGGQLALGATATGNDIRYRGDTAKTNAELTGTQLESAGIKDDFNTVQAGNSQALQAKNLGLAATGLGNTAAGLSMSNKEGGYTGLGAGTNIGTNAVNLQSNVNNANLAGNDIMAQGFTGNMSGNNYGSNALAQLYGMDMNAYNADQAASGAFWSGLGSAAGTLGGALIMSSSKDIKENKTPVEGSALEALEGIPVEAWDYKPGVEDEGRHIGPYAEDFKEATGAGDGKSIPVIDMLGLQLKAIQELGLEVSKLKDEKRTKGNVIEGEYEVMS